MSAPFAFADFVAGRIGRIVPKGRKEGSLIPHSLTALGLGPKKVATEAAPPHAYLLETVLAVSTVCFFLPRSRCPTDWRGVGRIVSSRYG